MVTEEKETDDLRENWRNQEIIIYQDGRMILGY